MRASLWRVLACCVLAVGCGMSGGVHGSLPVARYPSATVEGSDTAVVFIAGITDSPHDVERHEVVEIMRDAGIDAPMTVVHHAMGAYMFGRTTETLRAEVVAPARRGGHRRLLWVGFSGGSTAAIAQARTHPDDVDALILYAPYLGPDKIVREIVDAGGLANWTPHPPIEDVEREWMWLKGYLEGEPRPPLILLFGTEDLSRPTGKVLVEAGLTSTVFVAEGRHGWESWTQLWKTVWEKDPLGLTREEPAMQAVANLEDPSMAGEHVE